MPTPGALTGFDQIACHGDVLNNGTPAGTCKETLMRKWTVLGAALTVTAAAGIAAVDPIETRQVMMQSNGSAAAIAGGVMKGELEYNPVVGRAVVASLHATALAYGDFFPEGSGDDERTTASPKIWEDPEGFASELAKFREATTQAMEVSGRDGPPDAEAFTAVMGAVFDSCKTCHEGYRIER